VSFDGVAFAYPGTSREVLHDVSLSVEPGQVVAVVGFTGAGKSSVAKLLGRTYDPNAGRVLVDGYDLRDLDLTSYRRHLGVVPQDAFIFRGTVESNIAYGRPDATLDEVEAAARAVGAYGTLAELEGNFRATVEEEGRNLTAAERQLIALARMWLIGPDVLVLDEATASLDRDTEAAVLDAVCSLDRTIILVTHRLPVAERADRAFVIDAGRIIEQGTHAELLDANGPYARLWTVTGQVDTAPA
jgi:ATP-binding cassette subfamily B protein